MRLPGWIVCLMLLVQSASVSGAGATLDRLRADQEALVAAERDFRLRTGTLPEAEVRDYAAYIERLRQRLAHDCRLLQRSGVSVPVDVSCPHSATGGLAPVDIDQQNERTRLERTSTLDDELNAGLGEFDELLLREQQKVKASAPGTVSAGGSGSGSASGDRGPGASDGTDTAAAGADTEDRSATDEVPAGSEGKPGTAQGRPADATGRGAAGTAGAAGRPADIPDGSDDDVVARQLREAAEQETDPELKKRLWEEYRKYKQGTR